MPTIIHMTHPVALFLHLMYHCMTTILGWTATRQDSLPETLRQFARSVTARRPAWKILHVMLARKVSVSSLSSKLLMWFTSIPVTILSNSKRMAH